MKKLPRLAYFSPLLPKKSGIANYSEDLLKILIKYYAIDIITDQKVVSSLWIKQHCSIQNVKWFKKQASEYQGRILYQMGNSVFHEYMFPLLKHYPGIVVLHDFFLSGILRHQEVRRQSFVWTKALYESHGYFAVLKKEKNPEKAALDYPANYAILQQATGIITHSHSALALAKHWYSDTKKWRYIPLLREAPQKNWDREKVRADLGFSKQDFVVCSFGFLAPTKLNQELLEAWFDSYLSKESNCYLIFVGKNNEGIYGASLLKKINAVEECKKRIIITGFVSEKNYENYLIAADVAVQLRTQSRGETSKTVLDCMAYGVPVIANAHGSIAEFPKECIHFLPDVFSETELKAKLIYLKENAVSQQVQKAQTYLLNQHHPRYVAQQYCEAIEFFIETSTQRRQLDLMLDLVEEEKNTDLLDMAEQVVKVHPPLHQKQLFIDISELKNTKLLNDFLMSPPKGYRVEPVYKDVHGDYCYARAFTLKQLDCSKVLFLEDDKVEIYPGDVFLGKNGEIE